MEEGVADGKKEIGLNNPAHLLDSDETGDPDGVPPNESPPLSHCGTRTVGLLQVTTPQSQSQVMTRIRIQRSTAGISFPSPSTPHRSDLLPLFSTRRTEPR
ncbi:hypothetical protein CGMCC3_g13491 [Colletotrichum fructicola]|nr:uncharacterized protein CGMCC3_g13491 [Colletotrichum fructicola]KAE9570386.1 hypothetical protein CGMCC3_g13491 [Colletotrichum fructicola]